jgi:hypothetical protein
MFSFKSREKLARAEMALREAMAQHQEYLGKLNTALNERDEYLRQRDIALGERNEFLRQRDEALAEIERLKQPHR